ncbi:MAG: hypothetical protein WCJ46_05635 [bacterium]
MHKNKIRKTLVAGQKGQSLPVVIVLAAVLSILGATMVSLFQNYSKLQVKNTCIFQKQELAGLALEQCLYVLQQGNNWGNVPLENYYGYLHEFTTSSGTYTVHITNGNLYITNPALPTARQGNADYKTIGIKVKTAVTKCTGQFYAVVQKLKMGGPLISKGKIDFTTSGTFDNNSFNPDRANFFWGDIYSANTNPGYCKLRSVPVAIGTPVFSGHQPWKPRVYSANDIYTAISYNNGRTGTNYLFSTVYDDMSPTAHSHPFSPFAVAPDIDFEYYKNYAKTKNTYFGPGGLPLNLFTSANYMTRTVMPKLNSADSVVFIDTTDGLPLRLNSCNTYSGAVTVTAGTLSLYGDVTHQGLTYGTLIVMGPMIIKGITPSATDSSVKYSTFTVAAADIDNIYNVPPPDNFYSPQSTDNLHYVVPGSGVPYLFNVKHYGLIYAGGELRIGGTPGTSANASNVCIFGTIYLGENSALTTDTTDPAFLYVYFNKDMNLFGVSGASVEVLSFGEFSFLVPTPGPYPSSF